ncbi:MAG: alpha-amylase family protein [Planctomycetota bacterium]|jgi:hypothetical protein
MPARNLCLLISSAVLFFNANTNTLALETKSAEFVLENKHLTVTFEQSDTGPRIASIQHLPTKQTYRFGNSEEIGLAVVRPQDINNPKLKPNYKLQNKFRFVGITADPDKTRAILRFADDTLEIQVKYELQDYRPLLQKTVTCSAKQHAVYVAGVTLWRLKALNLKPIWPTNKRLWGQPVVLSGKTDGCFLTLEWPMARHEIHEDGQISIDYHPGYQISPGNSQEIATGSVGFFQCKSESLTDKLETARQSFFHHMAQRIKPKVPFPIKVTTWGPWLQQTRADRVLEVLDDMARIGVDICHIDAGWQYPDCPYSTRLPKLRNADTKTWDRQMTQPERFPAGLLPIARECKKLGLKMSLWFDSTSATWVRDGEQWAVRDKNGNIIYNDRGGERRWPKRPIQSLASPQYAEALTEFIMQSLKRYHLGGVMLDFVKLKPDYSTNRKSLASTFNSMDVQLNTVLEIMDECKRRKPDIYRFICIAHPWPWLLKHCTHIHAIDPGTTKDMAQATETDHPARALAYDRYLAWRQRYDQFVPPWGIKGDIAGWSYQQKSPIPINLKHTQQIIGTGEGWTFNMFMCMATTAVRDIRFSFQQMPEFDKQILKEWLAWDRKRTQFIFNCRPIFDPPDDPNRGFVGMSHVGNDQGVIYLFNRSFDLDHAEIKLDERAGFQSGDKNLSAYLVYPMRAPLGSGKLSYGQTLRVPVIGKDCAIVEVGLEKPQDLKPYADYLHKAQAAKRSFRTLFFTPLPELLEAVSDNCLGLEVGDHPTDRRLAKQIIETIGAGIGRPLNIDRLQDLPANQAGCRLIIGTHEGLINHPQIKQRFRQTLYNQYVEWDGELISAPLVAELTGSKIPTFCLIAPRPEQLARLAIDLVSQLSAGAKPIARYKPQKNQPRNQLSFTVKVPAGKPVLSFHPILSGGGGLPIPANLEMIRFEIHAEKQGKKIPMWNEDIPPFCGPQWWQDRLLSLANLAGQDLTLHLRAAHLDGQSHPQVTIGFKNVSVIDLKKNK